MMLFPDYLLQEMVWYDMLKASPYVVTDPATADFFYLPVYPYW